MIFSHKFVFPFNLGKMLFPALLLLSNTLHPQKQEEKSFTGWKGNSILGNGNICVVYSDDPRIIAESKGKGIQHFYFRDYTADYIRSTSFVLVDEKGSIKANAKKDNTIIGMDNFFTALSKSQLSNGTVKKVTCLVHPEDAAVVSLETSGPVSASAFDFQLVLRKIMHTDNEIRLLSLKKKGNTAIAEWSNHIVLAISPKNSKNILEVEDSVVSVYGISIKKAKSEIIISAAVNETEALLNIKKLKGEKDIESSASIYWNKWIASGILPEFKNGNANENYLEFYKRTLYAVKSATLNGQIPADMTGQFVTNNMPQLYPRDAMMCARVYLLTGHFDEARQLIMFWADKNIPKKSKGEYYARYDAHAKAVDAGSGARYDEPEWDANGYFIQLVNEFHKQKKEWLCEKTFLYELADFLVNNIDKSGLLYEGGIVEWTGYLPSTNMTCAVALETMSQVASEFGEPEKAAKYKKFAGVISAAIAKMFDPKRQTLAALRFHGVKAEGNVSISNQTTDTLYLWDTSLNFGILWGYPDNGLVRKTNTFIQNNNVKMNGGVQYFEASDNAWLSNYGGDLFFFTTSAAAEYQSVYGNNSIAGKHIDWMIRNSNSYGLMPERIYSNGSDCSPASPLSWCNAEFAAAILEWSKKLGQ